MKKLKLIISGYDDIRNTVYAGGGAHCVHELAKRFAKKYKVAVLTGNYKNAKEEMIDGVNYKRLGLSIFGPKLGQLVFHFLMPFYVKKTDHDIWFESFTPPFSTSFIPIFTKKPVIGLVHMLSGKEMKRKYKLPFNWLEWIGLKFYKNFIVMNDGDLERIKNVNTNAKVSLLGNGINFPKHKAKVKPQHILFLGRIEIGQKGIDLLLRAYCKYQEKIKFPLVIAGGGSKRQVLRLKIIIENYQLNSKIRLVGNVKGRKKLNLIKSSSFIVIPSRYETFSMVALESISQGIPLVTYDIEGLKWIPRNTRLVAKKFDIDDLGKKIVKMSSNTKLRSKLSRESFKFSKYFGWDNVFKKYLSFTNEVINKNQQIKKDDFVNFIDQSVKKRKKFLFISPHLDDAIFSAGGLISYLSKINADIEVINIFTNEGCTPLTLSAKRNLRLCNAGNVRILYEKRRKEDKAVFDSLGVKVHNLGMMEALYRKKKLAKKSFMSKYVPELLHLYPTYYLHILKGVIDKEDVKLSSKVIREFKNYERENVIVFCPLGNAGHVDHIISRNVSEKVFGNVIYYQDCPYKFTRKSKRYVKENNIRKYAFTVEEGQKEGLVKSYKSQTRSLSEVKMTNLLQIETFFMREI